jgi:hypothetical protein
MNQNEQVKTIQSRFDKAKAEATGESNQRRYSEEEIEQLKEDFTFFVTKINSLEDKFLGPLNQVRDTDDADARFYKTYKDLGGKDDGNVRPSTSYSDIDIKSLSPHELVYYLIAMQNYWRQREEDYQRCLKDICYQISTAITFGVDAIVKSKVLPELDDRIRDQLSKLDVF